jgi:hypothetical protein
MRLGSERIDSGIEFFCFFGGVEEMDLFWLVFFGSLVLAPFFGGRGFSWLSC